MCIAEVTEYACGHRSITPESGQYRVLFDHEKCTACLRLRGVQETWRASWSDVIERMPDLPRGR